MENTLPSTPQNPDTPSSSAPASSFTFSTPSSSCSTNASPVQNTSFSFGGTSPAPTSTPSSSAPASSSFTFSTPSSSSSTNASPVQNGLSFGGSGQSSFSTNTSTQNTSFATSASPVQNISFSFGGGTSAPSASSSTTSAPSSFSFGNAANTSFSCNHSAATPTSTSLPSTSHGLFGAPATTAPSSTPSFGTSFSFNSTAAAPTSTPLSSTSLFGAPASTAPSSAFSFGSTAAAASTTSTSTVGSVSLFGAAATPSSSSFGSGGTSWGFASSPSSTSFSFSSSSSAPSNPFGSLSSGPVCGFSLSAPSNPEIPNHISAISNLSSEELRWNNHSPFSICMAQDFITCDSTLTHDLGNLLEDGSYSDVTFEVEGCHIRAHKCLLGTRSNKFKDMFTSYGGYGEQIVSVRDVKYDVFKALVLYCYTGKLPCDLDMLTELLKAAEAYELATMKASCGQLLATRHVNNKTVLSLLKTATAHNSKELKGACIGHIINNFNCFDAAKMQELDKDHLVELLMESCSRMRISPSQGFGFGAFGSSSN